MATEADREWVASMVHDLGHVEAAKRVGLSRMTLYRILDGLPIFPSTLRLIRERIGGQT